MRVFVTGANGFIGRTLMRRLATDGHEVGGLDRDADPTRDVVAGDVTEPASWQERLRGVDAVVHTAAIVSNTPGLDEAWRVNVLGTRRVVDAAVAADVPRLVHVSSVRVFSDLGFPDGVTEYHPVRPDGNSYVDTRIASEQVALQAHAAGRLDVSVVRPGDVYGPESRPWTIWPVELIRRNLFMLPAGGRGVFSPVFADDLVDGFVRVLTRPEASGQVFTLAGGVGVPCAEFFGHYYRMLGRRGPLVLPTPVALGLAGAASLGARAVGRSTEINPTAVRYFCRTGTYSVAKAEALLGYRPSTSLERGMERTEEWLRAQSLV